MKQPKSSSKYSSVMHCTSIRQGNTFSHVDEISDEDNDGASRGDAVALAPRVVLDLENVVIHVSIDDHRVDPDAPDEGNLRAIKYTAEVA